MTLFAPVILLKKATICHLKGHFDILHNNGVLFYFIKSSVHVKTTGLFPTIFTSKDNFLFLPSWPRLSRPVFNAMLLCFVKVPSQCVHRYWTLAVNRVCETDSKNKRGKKYIHLTSTFNNQETYVRAWWEIRCWPWVSAAAERISNCFKPVKKKDLKTTNGHLTMQISCGED